MEKTSNRVILYNKKSNSVKKELPSPEPIAEKIPEGAKVLKIISWIKRHPLFKWSGMCSEIGFDRSNFKKQFESDVPILREDVIVKMENILKGYGYQ